MRSVLVALGLSLTAVAGASPKKPESRIGPETAAKPVIKAVAQLQNIRQLTNGGQNAEAYFSDDGKRVIFQSTRPPYECDQIYTMNIDGSDQKLASTGKGRTTCASFFPDNKSYIYASTHGTQDACPAAPDRSKGYVWPIYEAYEIYKVDAAGKVEALTKSNGYDAEGAVSPDGTSIVFTSKRDGDLDIYTMDADGKNVKRLTDSVGYDGGPFWSWDGKLIVYRSLKPRNDTELKDYKELLQRDLIKPLHANLFVMNADGSNKRQITDNNAANWAPFLHPDNRRIIFSSNQHAVGGRFFSLYMINIDGTGLTRITTAESFDSFPMFSKDGKRLIFASTQGAVNPHEYNIFVADWTDRAPAH